MAVKPRVVAGAAVFIGALAAGGISYAAAQTTSTTPGTTNPSQSQPAPGRGTAPDGARSRGDGNCPHTGGAGGSNSSDGSGGSDGSSTSNTASVEGSL